jgi:inhibitor of KinA sporulation pathway (predicted exonuclease)
MAKLHQILAVERDIAKTSQREITNVHHNLQKSNLLEGLTRSYRPKDEDGDRLPGETKLVQQRVNEAIDLITAEFEKVMNLEATKDYANCIARADVTLDDGTVLIPDAPATYLLWLEKKVQDICTFAQELPVLDPAENWTFDSNKNCYVTDPIETQRQKKVNRVLVKAEATDKHPAQTEVYQEDVLVGYWELVKFSGAIPASEKNKIVDRAHTVMRAVKDARSRANECETTKQDVAGEMLNYIFKGPITQ